MPDGAVRILVTAELPVIRERFAARMHGTLPPPAAAMPERRHGMFDRKPHDRHVHNGQTAADEICCRLVFVSTTPPPDTRK